MSSADHSSRPGFLPRVWRAATDTRLRPEDLENARFPHQAWHVFKIVIQGAARTNIARMAAALSYRTIFGLIPVLVVGLVLLKSFSTTEQMAARVRDVMRFSGLSQIAVEPPADESAFFETPDPAAAPAPASSASSAATPATPETLSAGRTQRLDAWIESLVLRVNSIRYDAIGYVGLAMLLYAAISMMVEIEKAFNHIFMAPVGRSWLKRITQYWTLLSLGMIFLVASFSAQQWLSDKVDELWLVKDSATLQQVVAMVATYGITVAISTAGLLVVYTTLPNTRVMFRPALVGAFLGALAWEAGKWGFTTYVKHSTGTAKLYGMIAILPLFLLWVYVTWMIVLMGLHVVHALQAYGAARTTGLARSVLNALGLLPEDDRLGGDRVVDPASILSVMLAVAQGFTSGTPASARHVAKATHLDDQVTSAMLERLCEAGYVARAGGRQEGSFLAARPLDAIFARDVILAGQAMTNGQKLPEFLVRARVDAAGDRTIADLLPDAG